MNNLFIFCIILSFSITNAATFFYNSSYPCPPPEGCSLLNPLIYSSSVVPGNIDDIYLAADSPSLFTLSSSLSVNSINSSGNTNIVINSASLLVNYLDLINISAYSSTINAKKFITIENTFYSYGSTVVTASMETGDSIINNTKIIVSAYTVHNCVHLDTCTATIYFQSVPSNSTTVQVSSTNPSLNSQLSFCPYYYCKQIQYLILGDGANVTATGLVGYLHMGNGFLYVANKTEFRAGYVTQIPGTHGRMELDGYFLPYGNSDFDSEVLINHDGIWFGFEDASVVIQSATSDGRCPFGGPGSFISHGNLTCPGHITIGSAYFNTNNTVTAPSFTTSYMRIYGTFVMNGNLIINATSSDNGITLASKIVINGDFTQNNGSIDVWICNKTETSPPSLDVTGNLIISSVDFTLETSTFDGNSLYVCTDPPQQILFAHSSSSIAAQNLSVSTSPQEASIEYSNGGLWFKFGSTTGNTTSLASSFFSFSFYSSVIALIVALSFNW